METHNKQNGMVQMRVEDVEKVRAFVQSLIDSQSDMSCDEFDEKHPQCKHIKSAEDVLRYWHDILALLPPTELPTHA